MKSVPDVRLWQLICVIKSYRAVFRQCGTPAGPNNFGLITTQYFALQLLFFLSLQHIFIIKEDLYALFSSTNVIRLIISRRMRWAGNVARIEGHERSIQEFCGETWGRERESPFGRTRHRGEDNIKWILGEVGWGGMVWIALSQSKDRWMAVVNAVLNLQIP